MTKHNLVFYTHPMSRGRIVRWMLEEVEAQYETVLMELGNKITDEEFLRLNPMGKVPVIVHNDTVVTECAAICAYLADVYPDAKLAPPATQRGPYYRWLIFSAGCLEPAAINHALGVEIPNEKEGMVGYRNLSATLDTLEAQISANSYLTGDEFTAADVYCASQLGWGMEMGTVEARPVFREYTDRLFGRPAAKRADEIDDAIVAKWRTKSDN